MLINETSQVDKYVSIDPNSIKPLPLLPTEYKFLNNSLPNSPRIGNLSLTRSHSRSPLSCVSESHLQRCKSGGENRSSVPYGGIDLWANLNNTSDQVRPSSKKYGNDHNGENRRTTTIANNVVRKKPNEMDFKCGALCLFLPAFGKGKPVRARRVEPQQVANRPMISQRISLEKFECGSWRSSAFNCDDEHTATLYFDLPLELIRTSVSDCALPMNSAFVFNKGGEVKSVLKTKTGERKSIEGRHVRFSISSGNKSEPTSPSCITPRLRKARDDFNAFLEAQSV